MPCAILHHQATRRGRRLTTNGRCPECDGHLYINRGGQIERIECGKTFGAAGAPAAAKAGSADLDATASAP